MNTAILNDLPGLTEQEKAALVDLVALLVERHRKGLHLLKLFGSKARGEGAPMSDIDILVVVKGDRWQMSQEVHDTAYRVVQKCDYLPFSLSVLDEDEYRLISRVKTSFYQNLEKDGIDLWKSEGVGTEGRGGAAKS